MKLKIANLVAIQFGIFVGTMSWLVYSSLPSNEPRAAAEAQESMMPPVAREARSFEPRNPRPHTRDYAADRDRARQRDEQLQPMSQDYDEEIAPEPYANSGPDAASIGGNSLSYTTGAQEPAVAPTEYVDSPQTVAYAQPPQFIAYPAETVVFSNSRSFGNRFRSTRPRGAFNAITHRPPNGGGPHQNIYQVVPGQIPNPPSRGPIVVPGQIPNPPSRRPIVVPGQIPNPPSRRPIVVPGQIPNAPSCPPTQGFRPRGNR
jgi:hypothetical protein